MEATFSIRQGLKESWELFKKYWQFFVVTTLVLVLLNILQNIKHIPAVLSLLLSVLGFLWGIVIMKISLAAAKGNTDNFAIKSIKTFFPIGWQQVLGYLGVVVLAGLISLGGFLLLIIPGIYFMFRLSFSSFAFFDRGEGVMKSLRYSWDITKGQAFWTTVLVFIVAMLLYFVGFILVGVGLLITFPLMMIFVGKFYHYLSVHYHGEVVVQPQEIVASHTETSSSETATS